MDWMRELADHYLQMRKQYPQDRLLLLFDIDGTILDMRYMMLDVLQASDRSFDTQYFAQLTVDDISVGEADVEELITQHCPLTFRQRVIDWYMLHRWDFQIMSDSHRPYPGVLEIIRWFQMQDNTFVGLNTSRPEALRMDTLYVLNRLGIDFRVRFDSNLLYMNEEIRHTGSDASKLAGAEAFHKQGYRVISMIDNQLENLHLLVGRRNLRETLLLHTDKLFASRRKQQTQGRAIVPHYDPAQLVCQVPMPRHVQMVWSDVGHEAKLQQFMASSVHWGGISIGPEGLPGSAAERIDRQLDKLAELLDRFRLSGRGVRLTLNGDEQLLYRLIPIITERDYLDSDLCFEGRLDTLGEKGFRAIAAKFPDSIRQCPIDFLAPLLIASPAKAEDVLDTLSGWGINRWSISWQTNGKRQVLDRLDGWGFDTNITDIPDMSAFLRAVLLLPRSITTDFSFPDCQPGSEPPDLQPYLMTARRALGMLG